LRTFIAIPLPLEIKNFLANLEEELKTCQADVKWVNSTNLHLTLKFLGEIKEEKIILIKKIIDKISQETHKFIISLSTLGTFPKTHLPKVIWVGIENEEEAKNLAKRLEEDLYKIGFPKEKRPFSSHITLGRLRSFKNIKILVDKLENLKDYPLREKKEFLVEKIILYKSNLTPQGPIYEELYSQSLKTN